MKAIYLLLIFVLIHFSGCNKSPTKDEDFIGNWELIQLLIDGHDTIAYIKADSSCYGYTRFLGNEKLLQLPMYNAPNFYCAEQGFWSYFRKELRIEYVGSTSSIGPYLNPNILTWHVLEKPDEYMKLYIVYESKPCYLTFKKR